MTNKINKIIISNLFFAFLLNLIGFVFKFVFGEIKEGEKIVNKLIYIININFFNLFLKEFIR